MPRIEFDFEVSTDDVTPLALALGCSEGQVETVLKNHAMAALSEYVEAYVGRRAFTRGSDILEHRLSLLIKHVFVGQLPTERQVSLLFQSSPSASRSLLRNTLARYRYALKDHAAKAAIALLESANWSSDQKAVHLKILSPNLLELLNERLREVDATKKGIKRLTDSVATFETTASAYAALCKGFGATEVPKP